MEGLAACASIVSIVDVLSRTLLKLHDLQKRFKEVDTTLQALVGELTATKAALSQLSHSLAKHSGSKRDPRIVADVESTITACELLVDVIDARLSALDSPKANLDTVAKLRAVVADGEVQDYLKRLSRILSALSIVLDGFERDNGPQLQIIQNEEERRTFEDVRNDSASLLVLWDAASRNDRPNSIVSYCSSIYSLRFPGLDEYLLEHRAYRKTLRSLVHRLRSSRSVEHHVSESGRSHSTASHNYARDDHTESRSKLKSPCTVKVSMCGDAALISFLMKSSILSGKRNDDLPARLDVTRVMRLSMFEQWRTSRPNLGELITSFSGLSFEGRTNILELITSIESPQSTDDIYPCKMIGPELFAEVIENTNPHPDVLEQELLLQDPAVLLNRFLRMWGPSYVPTDADVLSYAINEAQKKRPWIQTATIPGDPLSIELQHILNINSLPYGESIIKSHDSAAVYLFVLDARKGFRNTPSSPKSGPTRLRRYLANVEPEKKSSRQRFAVVFFVNTMNILTGSMYDHLAKMSHEERCSVYDNIRTELMYTTSTAGACVHFFNICDLEEWGKKLKSCLGHAVANQGLHISPKGSGKI